MMQGICKLWYVVFLLILSANITEAKQCVAAFDFGQGTSFYIPANPDAGNSGSESKLIYKNPKNKQVAPWVATNFITLGNPEGSQQNNIKIRVSGAWTPWGGDPEKIKTQCEMQPCDPADANQIPCLKGGMSVKINDDASNIPCVMSKGWGLYGLIAIDKNNGRKDPNNPLYARTLPNEYFRTFRVAPLKSDADGDYFELSFTEQCDLDDNGQTICVVDADKGNLKKIVRGDLYFKIIDNYYPDNEGEYVVTILSGIAGKKGFIQETIEFFTYTMSDVTEKMYKSFTSGLGFITIVRALLVMYVLITGFLFMLGLLREHVSELVVRLFKVGVIAALISHTSWEFFNTYLFSFFTVGAQSIATMISKAAFAYTGEVGGGQFILPEDMNSLSVFDNILKMLISPSIHYKIAALLFYKWYGFVYMVFIYICIGILMLAIIRSVMLYVVAIMLVALMLVISPVFILMILFQATKELFDTWLKQLLSNALLLIIVSASIAIMANLVLNQLESILYYKACWDIVWSLEIGSWTLFDLWFWYPNQPSQLDECLTPINFFSFLFVCILFNAFMQEIPELIDSLSGAFLQPITKIYGNMTNTFMQTTLYRKTVQYIEEARSIVSPTSLLLLTERGRGILRGGHGVYDTVTGKFERAMGETGWNPDTQFLNAPRDLVGKVIDAGVDKVTHKNRGVFDDKDEN
jgi:type IV secretion system protein VirB6